MRQLPAHAIEKPLYAASRLSDTRGRPTCSSEKFTVTTQVLRQQVDVIDVTVSFRLVEICPGTTGRWQGEPADRFATERTEFFFAFTGAAPDDPDDPPLTADELMSLGAWFWNNHDTATEHAADRLRGDGL